MGAIAYSHYTALYIMYMEEYVEKKSELRALPVGRPPTGRMGLHL